MMGTTQHDGAPFLSFPQTTNASAYYASQGFTPPSAALFPTTSTGNLTKDLYTTASRLSTDGLFRCVDEATANTLLNNARLDQIYYYEFDRTYQTKGWPGTDVCDPPSSAAHPNGDPSQPYLKCHSGELYYVFGNLARQGLPLRDAGDLPFEQFVLDTFVAFMRTGDPNVEVGYARARGYTETAAMVERAEKWVPAKKGKLGLQVLDWPKAVMSGFRDGEQCDSLGLGLKYYEK